MDMYRKEWPEFLASIGRIAAGINEGDSLLRELGTLLAPR